MEHVRDRYVVAGHDNLVSFCGFLSPCASDIVAVGMYYFVPSLPSSYSCTFLFFPLHAGFCFSKPFSGWRQV